MPGRSRKKRRVYGPADREARNNNKVIKAFRVMDSESSMEIAAVTRGLDWDEDRLEYEKIPKVHQAFILDPRIVNAHFKRGFEAHASFERARRAAHRQVDESEDWIQDAEIGDVYVRNRRHVLAPIISPTMTEETRDMKDALGDEGIRGLRGSHARRVGGLTIYIAQLKPHVLPNAEVEASYVNALDTAFAVHAISSVTFGPLQVVDR